TIRKCSQNEPSARHQIAGFANGGNSGRTARGGGDGVESTGAEEAKDAGMLGIDGEVTTKFPYAPENNSARILLSPGHRSRRRRRRCRRRDHRRFTSNHITDAAMLEPRPSQLIRLVDHAVALVATGRIVADQIAALGHAPHADEMP